ncbi:MAG: glycoside hydrolase family 31 protein [Niastella sp.]|nr:glycoside hydrolase family 31 protein [Niastella sp.]
MMTQPFFSRLLLSTALLVTVSGSICAQQITTGGAPARLDIREAGANSIRVTLKPVSFAEDFAFTPAVAERKFAAPVISLRELKATVKKKVGSLQVEVHPSPLTVIVSNSKGQAIQQLVFQDDGKLSFDMGDQPILGMGEGGPKPERGVNWRALPIEYDRRGRMHNMEPRWQSDAYGSRNPVALLVGTGGWGLFVATPWVQVDMQQKDKGFFIPWQPPTGAADPQTEKNQGLNQGKGKPPIKEIVPGLYDVFVFDAHEPAAFMKDFSVITGPATMPPKWALGYMQSHRTLDTDKEMMGVIDSFRAKKIPVDAVIYLGTGFTPRGWNTMQPSFDFNPEVFKNDPRTVLANMHKQHVKVVMHMVPWDRDKLPTLQGTIPARPGEPMDASHIKNYWQQHVGLVNMGVDAFWPDEGDWFNLFERIKRHQLYYQGHLSTQPNKRPWSLQRNGFPGIAQWGGWVWSGDTESSWKTLEGQVAVGINYSLSIGPYWGSDIGGFYPNAEKTAELYTRWYQFGAFCGSFRSHGRTWFTALPWGYGLSDMGPRENNNRNTAVGADDPRNIKQSEMNNPTIEPINRKYTELHYQLLPYTYTLAWEARNSGMPLMRAMWLHYPNDPQVLNMGSQYLWGRDMLIAPVFEKGATTRKVYLPKGDWYDWWSGEKQSGGQTVSRNVDLTIMPIYVRAGAIIPFDPIRQYIDQPVNEPTTLRIYTGADGDFTLYEDDGISQDYTKGKGSWTRITWSDKGKKLTLAPQAPKGAINEVKQRSFKVLLLPQGTTKEVTYTGKAVNVSF